jgi:hypothetical protein
MESVQLESEGGTGLAVRVDSRGPKKVTVNLREEPEPEELAISRQSKDQIVSNRIQVTVN